MSTTSQYTLSNDPDFQMLYRSASSIGTQVLRSGSKLSKDEKKRRIASLQTESPAEAQAALKVVGVSKKFVDEQRRLSTLLIDRYHLPLDGTLAGTFGDAAAAAKWSHTEENGGGPAPDPWEEMEDELDLPDTTGGSGDDDAPGGGLDCYDGCAAQAAALGAVAVASYASALAACTLTGPFWPLCVAPATAAYLLALYEMDAVVDRCVANCDG